MPRDENDRRGRFIIMISFPSASATISYGTIKGHVGILESHPPSENDFRKWSFHSEDPTDLITDLLTQLMKSMLNDEAFSHTCRKAVVLCYPNTWSESHRQTMSFCIRQALVAAKVSQTEDTRDLYIFPESEICLMNNLAMQSSLMCGDVFIHLNAGDGILDVCTYKVDCENPLMLRRLRLQHRSLSPISTCIDRGFQQPFTVEELDHLNSLDSAMQNEIETAMGINNPTFERVPCPTIVVPAFLLTGEDENIEALAEHVLGKKVQLLELGTKTTRSQALFEGAAHLVANKDEWYHREPYGTR